MHTVLITETKAKTIERQKKNKSPYSCTCIINVWGYTEILPLSLVLKFTAKVLDAYAITCATSGKNLALFISVAAKRDDSKGPY